MRTRPVEYLNTHTLQPEYGFRVFITESGGMSQKTPSRVYTKLRKNVMKSVKCTVI